MIYLNIHFFRVLKTSRCTHEMDAQAIHILNPTLINGCNIFIILF